MTTTQNEVTLAGLYEGRVLRRGLDTAFVLMIATDDTGTSFLVEYAGTEWVLSLSEVSKLFTF